ncbi:MAG: hypothetical protein ACRDJY_06100 [Thermoleophilaceae bacterium]
MNDATPAAMQRLLAGEFERRGWEWDLAEGRRVVEEIVAHGGVDAQRLARGVSGTYLQRVGATTADMADAIERAVGGRVPRPEAPAPTILVINDHRYSLAMGPGAQITGGALNLGGTQINIQSGTSRDEVLQAVRALVHAGLSGDWNPDAARELGEVLGARDDVALEDVQEVVSELGEGDPPDQGRIKQMLTDIATQGLGGTLGTGLSSALGALLKNPPI